MQWNLFLSASTECWMYLWSRCGLQSPSWVMMWKITFVFFNILYILENHISRKPKNSLWILTVVTAHYEDRFVASLYCFYIQKVSRGNMLLSPHWKCSLGSPIYYPLCCTAAERPQVLIPCLKRSNSFLFLFTKRTCYYSPHLNFNLIETVRWITWMEMTEKTSEAVLLKPTSGWSVGNESFSFSLLYLHRFRVVM